MPPVVVTGQKLGFVLVYQQQQQGAALLVAAVVVAVVGSVCQSALAASANTSALAALATTATIARETCWCCSQCAVIAPAMVAATRVHPSHDC